MINGNSRPVLEQVITIIADITGKEEAELEADTDLIGDLALDSLALYEIVIELEGMFELQISDEDIEKIRTIGEAAAYIERYSKSGGQGAGR